MREIVVGRIKLTSTSDGEHPMYVEIAVDGKFITITHNDLRDLKDAVEETMRAAKDELPENYKHEA